MVGKADTVDITEQMLQSFDLGGQDRARLWDARITGFGVTIGKRRVTFVAQRRVDGEQRTVVLGHWGAPKVRSLAPDLMSVARAREAAILALADMRRGEDPRSEERRKSEGPTLGDAFDLHVARMRANQATERSITTITSERDKYLADWVKRPLRSIERADCRALHETLSKKNGPTSPIASCGTSAPPGTRRSRSTTYRRTRRSPCTGTRSAVARSRSRGRSSLRGTTPC